MLFSIYSATPLQGSSAEISKMESTSQLSTNLNTISFGKRKKNHVNSVTFQFQGKCVIFFLQRP